MKLWLSTALFAAGSVILPAAQLDLVPLDFRDRFPGERVNFTATAWESEGQKLSQGTFTVTFRDSGGAAIGKPVTVDLAKKNPAALSVTPTKPGFILAVASPLKMPDGSTVKWDTKPFAPLGGVAVQPQKISTGTERPADFDSFWQEGLDAYKNAEVIVTPAPEIKRRGYQVSRVTVKFPDGSGAIYGFLSIPAKPGKYPAIAGVPGAGPGSVGPTPYHRAKLPAIELWMNVHNFPTAANIAEQRELYRAYQESFPSKNYFLHQAEDRNQYIYRKVWPALSRAVDYVAALPEFDGKHFAMAGNSQGGGTALAVGSLNPNITCIAATVPALCDHGGWKAGRKEGWPQLHTRLKGQADEASAYFDCANFADKIKVPVFLSVGYVDTTCPPSSVYAVYNKLSCPKTIVPMYRAGHAGTPEVRAKVAEFLTEELKK